MDCVDLIPAGRREAKARRARVRRWAIALAVYLSVAMIGYIACYVSADNDDEATRLKQEVAERIRASRREVQSLRSEIDDVSRKLAIAHAVGKHPDWSLLLATVSDLMAGEVMLGRCSLTPVAPAEGRDQPGSGEDTTLEASRPKGFLLALDGLATTQTAVSQFVLRLEKTKLFAKVRLIKTYRQEFLGGRVAAFQLECLLDGQGGQKP